MGLCFLDAWMIFSGLETLSAMAFSKAAKSTNWVLGPNLSASASITTPISIPVLPRLMPSSPSLLSILTQACLGSRGSSTFPSPETSNCHCHSLRTWFSRFTFRERGRQMVAEKSSLQIIHGIPKYILKNQSDVG